MEFKEVFGLVELALEVLLEVHHRVVLLQVGMVVTVLQLYQMLIFSPELLDILF